MSSSPTLSGFIAFIRNVMVISTTVLPDNSVYIAMAYDVALSIVNQALVNVAVNNAAKDTIYSLAVYNLAGDNLINYAQDLPDAAPIVGSKPPMPFFQYSRKVWNISGFVSGVIQSTGDEGTNSSFVVQKAAENFTLSDLQNLKTPYGRQYLAFAQRYGTLWGLT